jgi:alkaline phosphatase
VEDTPCLLLTHLPIYLDGLGGLQVLANNGAGNYPTVTWGTTGHTATPVPVFARGIGADSVSVIMDNTEIFNIMINAANIHP